MRLAFALLLLAGLAPLAPLAAAGAPESNYLPVHTFDPARNASADIDAAIAEARKTGKRILLEVGGDWCPWCRALNELLRAHPDLLALRDAAFVTVNVYYGPDRNNERALSRYSKILGIPHCFVLDSNGTLLHSQHMLELETDGNYSAEKMRDFLVKWSAGTSGEKGQP